MGKHYHPGDAFAYILEGTMLLEIVGKESVTLKPGQSGSLPPRTVHDDKKREPNRSAEIPGVPRREEGRAVGCFGAVSERRCEASTREGARHARSSRHRKRARAEGEVAPKH